MSNINLNKAIKTMTTPILFLDIDGVLNAHQRLASGYCGIDRDKAAILNGVLAAVPHAKLVISSAWRYLVLRGDMTLKGFEYLLLVHGINAADRIHGYTAADGQGYHEANHFDAELWRKAGLSCRAEQIMQYVREHSISRWAVVDDLDLQVPNFVRTDGMSGISEEDAEWLIRLLQGSVSSSDCTCGVEDERLCRSACPAAINGGE